MQISLNLIDILCLHIFFWIRSNSRITFIVFGGGGELIYVLSIAFKKNIHAQQHNYRKFSPTTQNNKQKTTDSRSTTY